jgi:hypothetical protein
MLRRLVRPRRLSRKPRRLLLSNPLARVIVSIPVAPQLLLPLLRLSLRLQLSLLMRLLLGLLAVVLVLVIFAQSPVSVVLRNSLEERQLACATTKPVVDQSDALIVDRTSVVLRKLFDPSSLKNLF